MKKLKIRLYDIVEREMFFPGIVGLFVNPFYFARKGLTQHIGELGNHITGKTLDIGCGIKPYERLFLSSNYVGLEIDSEENRIKKNADYYYDGNKLPFADASFDSVVANEVFEHVFNPEGFIGEVYRVLKPGGKLLMTTPFVWDEHEQPYDYARYSSFGIHALLERHNISVVEQRKSIDDVRVIFQLINTYLYKITRTDSNYINLVLTMLLMAPWNILGELAGFVLPRNPDFYLDNIVLAQKAIEFNE